MAWEVCEGKGKEGHCPPNLSTQGRGHIQAGKAVRQAGVQHKKNGGMVEEGES